MKRKQKMQLFNKTIHNNKMQFFNNNNSSNKQKFQISQTFNNTYNLKGILYGL